MNFRGKRVLLRVDFNAPFKFRLLSTLPTIKLLLRKEARIVLLTHLERDGNVASLDTLAKELKKYFPTLFFVKEKITPPPKDFFKKHTNNIFLLDNVRLDSREMANNNAYSKILAKWGDCYVNDAFAASHRSHASIVGVPKYLPHESGPLMKREIKELSRFFKPEHPFVLILGGKKFKTKEPLVSRFVKIADTIFIGGALANTFLCQRGYPVGKTKIEDENIPNNILWNKKIFLPDDVVVSRGGKKVFVPLNEIQKDDVIYDAGTRSLDVLADKVCAAKFVLWNGTLGICEEGFNFGSRTLAKVLGASRAHRVVGGGDTVDAIQSFRLEKNFDFISTGGGAMLEFLAHKTLPGIKALKH